jgi:hypothetical protein
MTALELVFSLTIRKMWSYRGNAAAGAAAAGATPADNAVADKPAAASATAHVVKMSRGRRME